MRMEIPDRFSEADFALTTSVSDEGIQVSGSFPWCWLNGMEGWRYPRSWITNYHFGTILRDAPKLSQVVCIK